MLQAQHDVSQPCGKTLPVYSRHGIIADPRGDRCDRVHPSHIANRRLLRRIHTSHIANRRRRRLHIPAYHFEPRRRSNESLRLMFRSERGLIDRKRTTGKSRPIAAFRQTHRSVPLPGSIIELVDHDISLRHVCRVGKLYEVTGKFYRLTRRVALLSALFLPSEFWPPGCYIQSQTKWRNRASRMRISARVRVPSGP